MNSKKLTRIASKARKIVANAIRKMHVPAYWPVEAGVQAMEKRGVVVEVKNVIAIESIPIIEEEDESMDIDVEEAMDMSIVEVAADAMVVVMLMPDMSMLDISILILW